MGFLLEMMLYPSGRFTLSAVLLGLALATVVSSPASAYTGGPVRAHIAGYDRAEHRVFYYLIFSDESNSSPQVWFFDLDATDPTKPVRAPLLESGEDGTRRGSGSISAAWRSFSGGLEALQGRRCFDISLSLQTDGAGVDTLRGGDTGYHAHLAVETEGRATSLDFVAFYDTMIAVRGVYEIPGREEFLMVLTYRGRAYGAEEVERPILIPAN